MFRSLKTRVALGAVMIVAVMAVAIAAFTMSRDGGEDIATDTGETGSAPIRATAIVATDDGEATPLPRPTAVLPDPPAPVATSAPSAAPPRPLPHATPTPAATGTPIPRVTLVTPTGTPTPVPTPPPSVTGTPVPRPTAIPLPTPVGTPQPAVDAEIDPPLPGECLHCWVYVSVPAPLPTDEEYQRTETFLRERYAARTARVGVCDTCPYVFDHATAQAGVRAGLLHPRPSPDDASILTLALHPAIDAQLGLFLEDDPATAIGEGWVVPVSTTHHIRDVAGMVVHPAQTYPRHEPGAWAITPRGFAAVRDTLTSSTLQRPVAADAWPDDCTHCWRYTGEPAPVVVRDLEAVTLNLQERFTGSGGDTTCPTCPWAYDGEDLDAAVAVGWLRPRQGLRNMVLLDLGQAAARLFDEHQRMRPGTSEYLQPIGASFSAEQVGRMLSYPSMAPDYFHESMLVVTNSGMAALERAAAGPYIPYTPLLFTGYTPFSDLPLSFCVVPLEDADESERLHSLTTAAAETWNSAVDVSAFRLSGTCASGVEVSGGNQRNEVYVDPTAVDHGHAARAPHRLGNDRDVAIAPLTMEYPEECIMRIIMHEFGHHLGFWHGEEVDSIMTVGAHTLATCASRAIQPWEAAQLREAWGLD